MPKPSKNKKQIYNSKVYSEGSPYELFINSRVAKEIGKRSIRLQIENEGRSYAGSQIFPS